MKVKKTWVAAIAAAAMGGGMLLAATPAFAAAPSWEPDPQAHGSVAFYNAAGVQVTSGNDLTHLFDFAAASSNDDGVNLQKANVSFAYPNHSLPTSSWFVNGATSSTNYPVATPASLAGFGNRPVATVGTGMNYTASSGGATLDTTAGFAGIVQIRLKQSGNSVYWSGDIQVNTTNNTWRQVYPVIADTTTTTLASSVNPVNSGANTTLTATVQTGDLVAGAGTVQFDDGGTNLGTPVALNAGGVATKVFNSAVVSTHTIHATFIPADSSSSGQSASSATLSQVVQTPPPADSTNTAVTGATTGTVGTGQQMTATVTDTAAGHTSTVPVGSVQFKVDGTNVGSPVALNASGVATFQYTPGDTAPHAITAAFTPTNSSLFSASSDSTGVTVTASAPAFTPDPQNFTVTVPAGTLVISTPYTANHPFNLGTLVLNASGTQYATVPAAFGTTAAAGTDPGNLDANPTASLTNGVTITDTRANSTGWTASAQAGDFSDGGGHSIDGNGLSFTGVTPKYLTGNHLQAGSVTTTDITAFKTAAKAFATTTQGPGTVDIYGFVSLVAPTSSVAGTYTATVTFTVV